MTGHSDLAAPRTHTSKLIKPKRYWDIPKRRGLWDPHDWRKRLRSQENIENLPNERWFLITFWLDRMRASPTLLLCGSTTHRSVFRAEQLAKNRRATGRQRDEWGNDETSSVPQSLHGSKPLQGYLIYTMAAKKGSRRSLYLPKFLNMSRSWDSGQWEPESLWKWSATLQWLFIIHKTLMIEHGVSTSLWPQ